MLLGRVIPLALVLGGAIAHAASETLPAIFTARQETAAPSNSNHDAVGFRLPTSDRLRGLLIVRALERAETFASPGMLTLSPISDARMVVMEKFVVESTPLRVIELRPPDPPLWNFVKTGNLFRINGEKVSAEANMKFFIIESIGTRPREYTRAELQFSFAW